MTISLDDLESGVGTLRVEVNGKPLNIKYHLGANLPAMLKKIDAISRSNELSFQIDECIDVIAALAISWDLVDKKRKPVPVTKELLERFKYDILLDIVKQMQDEVTGEAQDSGISGASEEAP